MTQPDSTPQQLSLLSYDPQGLGVQHIGPELGIESRADHSARLSKAAKQVDAAHAHGTLGFLYCIDDAALVGHIQDFAAQTLQSGRFTDQLVLGIGGSSLGARAVLASARREHRQGLRTHFSENIDPVTWRRGYRLALHDLGQGDGLVFIGGNGHGRGPSGNGSHPKIRTRPRRDLQSGGSSAPTPPCRLHACERPPAESR